MASSTTIPMERIRAKRVKVFKVKPKNKIKVKQPTIEVGMAKRILKVEAQEPKKNRQTTAVRKAANAR